MSGDHSNSNHYSMSISKGFYPNGTRYGVKRFCVPIDHATGNPLGACMPSSKWQQKYSYSAAQVTTLLKEKKIKGFRYKKVLYILDQAPTEID